MPPPKLVAFFPYAILQVRPLQGAWYEGVLVRSVVWDAQQLLCSSWLLQARIARMPPMERQKYEEKMKRKEQEKMMKKRMVKGWQNWLDEPGLCSPWGSDFHSKESVGVGMDGSASALVCWALLGGSLIRWLVALGWLGRPSKTDPNTWAGKDKGLQTRECTAYVRESLDFAVCFIAEHKACLCTSKGGLCQGWVHSVRAEQGGVAWVCHTRWPSHRDSC